MVNYRSILVYGSPTVISSFLFRRALCSSIRSDPRACRPRSRRRSVRQRRRTRSLRPPNRQPWPRPLLQPPPSSPLLQRLQSARCCLHRLQLQPPLMSLWSRLSLSVQSSPPSLKTSASIFNFITEDNLFLTVVMLLSFHYYDYFTRCF